MKSTAKRKSSVRLPEPGKKKKNARELDKLLDKGVEDSMAASDPPAVTQPEVHTEADREPDVETGRDGGRESNVETGGAGRQKI